MFNNHMGLDSRFRLRNKFQVLTYNSKNWMEMFKFIFPVALVLSILISCSGPDKSLPWKMINEKDLGNGLCEFYFVQSTGKGLPHRKEIQDSCGKYTYLQQVKF